MDPGSDTSQGDKYGVWMALPTTLRCSDMPLYDGVVDSERRAGGGGGKGGGGVELRQGSVGRAGVGQALERLDGNGAAAAFYEVWGIARTITKSFNAGCLTPMFVGVWALNCHNLYSVGNGTNGGVRVI
jgi:hypothetical protein